MAKSKTVAAPVAPSIIAGPDVQAEYFKALQAEIAKLKAQIAAPPPVPSAPPAMVTVGAKAPRGKSKSAAAPVANPDAPILAKVLAKYGADNGHGPHTFNWNYSVKRPANAPMPFRMIVQTPDGPKSVTPTVQTIAGAALGVQDFRQTPTFSGKGLVWTSADLLKRMAAAGYVVTSRGKLTTAEVARNRGAAPATAADAVSLDSLL